MHCVQSGEAAGEPDVSSNTAVHPLIADAIEEAGFTAAKLPVPSNVDSDGGVRYRIPNSDMEVSTYVDEDGAFVGIDHDDEPAFTSQTMCAVAKRETLAAALLAAADGADSLRRREHTIPVRSTTNR